LGRGLPMPSKSKLADVCSLPEPSVEEEERVDLRDRRIVVSKVGLFPLH